MKFFSLFIISIFISGFTSKSYGADYEDRIITAYVLVNAASSFASTYATHKSFEKDHSVEYNRYFAKTYLFSLIGGFTTTYIYSNCSHRTTGAGFFTSWFLGNIVGALAGYYLPYRNNDFQANPFKSQKSFRIGFENRF